MEHSEANPANSSARGRWQTWGWGEALLAAALAWLSVPQQAAAATYDVQIEDFEFIPHDLVIAPGDTVVWHANAADHTVTADDLSFDSSPPPAVVTIPSGTTFTHTFAATGLNHYYCRIHGGPATAQSAKSAVPGGFIANSVPDNMTGIVRVADPNINTPPEKPLNSTPGAGATGLSNSPLLQATAFSDPDSDDRHASSQWLVRIVSTGEVVLDTGEDATNLTKLRIADLAASTVYEWQVRYRDDRGAWSEYSAATQFTVSDSAGLGTGLKGTYFAYDAKHDVITRQIATRLDPVLDFEWGLGKPHPSAPANNFFIYWEGAVLPQFSEEYRFRIKADGGVRLWVNGELIIDDPVSTKFALFRSGSIALEAGIPVMVRIQYFDTGATASMHLRWSSPSQALQIIPQARLFPEI